MKDPYIFDFIPFKEDMVERDIAVSYTHLGIDKFRQPFAIRLSEARLLTCLFFLFSA